jgi:hypothetical protein
MMEAVRTSETSVDNHFTRQYNPEDSSEHHTRCRENLKCHNFQLAFVSLKLRWRSFVQGYVLGGDRSCARMRFKQQYLRYHSELATYSFELFYS